MEARANQDDSALLVVGTHCSHCPRAMQALTELLKQGELKRLEIVNLEADPQAAAALGVRSVPFVRIGPFELTGVRSREEYREWIRRARDPAQGMGSYIAELLSEGEVGRVEELVAGDPANLCRIVALMDDADAKINLRLGIGAVIEGHAGSDEFLPCIDALVQHTRHSDARVRADACHYLALTGRAQVMPVLETLLQDASEEVREVAADGLRELG